VGRTSVEAVVEDPAALGEMRDMNPMARRAAWTQQRLGRRSARHGPGRGWGVGARGMDPMAAGEVCNVDPAAVSEAPVLDLTAVGEEVGEAMVVHVWKWSRSGRTSGGGGMIVARVRV
jgi:hypothetical protein